MKRSYRYFSFLIIALIAGLNFSCSNENAYKIGMLIPNIIDDRFPKDRDNFTAEVKKLGGEVIAMECKNDDKIQIQQAQDLIDQGVKVLAIICVNKNTAATIVREAHKKGVKVIAYDRIISNCDLDYYVSFDNVKVGELMALGALKVKPEGNYMLLGGDKSDQNAIWVREGMNNIINQKVVQSLKSKLLPILCIGENTRDNGGEYLKFIKEQIDACFLNISKSQVKNIVIAYEPIWAIGDKALREASPEEFTEIKIFIRKVLADIYNFKIAQEIKILYGGSVHPNNAEKFISNGGADGFLVGRDSLIPNKFNAIAKFAK